MYDLNLILTIHFFSALETTKLVDCKVPFIDYRKQSHGNNDDRADGDTDKENAADLSASGSFLALDKKERIMKVSQKGGYHLVSLRMQEMKSKMTSNMKSLSSLKPPPMDSKAKISTNGDEVIKDINNNVPFLSSTSTAMAPQNEQPTRDSKSKMITDKGDGVNKSVRIDVKSTAAPPDKHPTVSSAKDAKYVLPHLISDP